jgi:hypothetical protein
VLGGVFLLSLATTKRETYLLPLLPPLAILMALAMEDALEASRETLGAASRWLWGRIQPILLSLWGLSLPVALVVYTSSPRLSYLVLGAVALVVGIAGVTWGFQGNLVRAWEAHRISAAILCIAALALAVPVVESQKDMAPFARWVGEQVPSAGPIPATGADETLCGIIPFATGRWVKPLSAASIDELAVSGQAPGWVLEQAGDRSGIGDLGHLGYLMVREQRFGPGRTLRLWKRFPQTEPSPP